MIPREHDVKNWCDRKPTFGAIVVVEDDARMREELADAVMSLGFKCNSCETDGQFDDLCRDSSMRFDGASLDWQLKRSWCGAQLVQCMKSAGRIFEACLMYTKHFRRVEKAADINLEKRADDLTDYKLAIVRLIRLTIGRKLVSEIDQSLRCNTTRSESLVARFRSLHRPRLECEEFFSGTYEDELCGLARDMAFHKFATTFGSLDAKRCVMLQLLKQRAWWSPFDISSFTKLSTGSKLQLLTEVAGIEFEDVAQICDVPKATLRPVMYESTLLSYLEIEPKNRVLRFLLLLDRLLSIGSYEPEYMGALCESPRVLELHQSPPWEIMGLCTYLKHRGETGVNECLDWCFGRTAK